MKFKRTLTMILSLMIALSTISVVSVKASGFSIKGDVNEDGSFDISDVVLFQKWLLAVPDVQLNNWQNADFCKDGKLDVFDLVLMRRELVTAHKPEHIATPACKAAAFACVDDNELLYNDNINIRIAPASLTKLLTASVALYYLDSDMIVTVGSEQNLVKSGSSLCLIRQGHKLKLYDLLTGMLMASGNDAAYTIAVTTARAVYPDEYLSDVQAVERFSDLMNDFATQIGMQNSHFTTPEGWDDANQYTTVRDLLTLSKYALSVPEIRESIGNYQKYVVFASGENITWTNTNNMLNPNSPYYCPYAIGMKTGTTADAGNCLIGAYTINDKTYISVVVGCANNADRYNLTSKIISELEDLL